MDIFDLIGPIMVGPSSSHTAGAVRIGLVSRKLLGEPPAEAELYLYGSFADTGLGHGTDKALVAGLLGMEPDDERIPDSFRYAQETGLRFTFGTADLRAAHPNSVLLKLRGISGACLEVTAASIGGGRIQIRRLGDLELCFSAEQPTLIVKNEDSLATTLVCVGLFCLFSFPFFKDYFAFFAFTEADYVRKQGSHQCIHYVFRYARNHFGRLVCFSHGK